MKRWIAKQWIALAEVFGWPVPSWIRHLVPAAELDALLAGEKELTEALKADAPQEIPMPAFLDTRIERAIVESSGPARPGTRWIGLLVPSSAFAMAVVVGFIMFSNEAPQVEVPEAQPELVVSGTTPAVNTSRALTTIGKGLSSLEEGLIMKPLAMEQKRLATDVTHALKFFSSSVLPDSYAKDVNSRLDSFNEDVSNSI
jgi:hypothetical protein